jgi:hypothetical protein
MARIFSVMLEISLTSIGVPVLEVNDLHGFSLEMTGFGVIQEVLNNLLTISCLKEGG